MKKGKELKINQFKNYNIVYGSVDNKNPKALYINISAWAEPRNEDEARYGRVIRNFDKKIRQSVYNLLGESKTSLFSKDRTVVDFDIKESGVKYGKKSFANCEVTLYLVNELSLNSEYLQEVISDLIDNVIKFNFENSRDFNFHKKKS
jgi:hypothetical protein